MAAQSMEAAPSEAGWKRPRGTPSLSEVFGTIATKPSGSFWRKLLAFLGPGYLVAVGYMDPGNWATSLAGGSKFGYSLLTVIAVCFAIQIALANPDWAAVIRGFAPTTSIVTNPDMLYLAIGIIGATVMPHNLYLHSGVVQTRRFGESVPDRREAIKLATADSTMALMFALLINAS